MIDVRRCIGVFSTLVAMLLGRELHRVQKSIHWFAVSYSLSLKTE
jgi:hypothetical protein